MKTLIFICLKILEIIGTGIVFLIICLMGFYFNHLIDKYAVWYADKVVSFMSFCYGLVLLLIIGCILSLIAGIFLGIYSWINANRSLADKIYKYLNK
jgi:hypothetical protein